MLRGDLRSGGVSDKGYLSGKKRKKLKKNYRRRRGAKLVWRLRGGEERQGPGVGKKKRDKEERRPTTHASKDYVHSRRHKVEGTWREVKEGPCHREASGELRREKPRRELVVFGEGSN